MNTSILLDTCAAIWLVEDAHLSDEAVEAVDAAFDRGEAIHVSPITAWEIGMLAARGRFKTTLSPQLWFRRLLGVPGVVLAELLPEVLIASSFLPDSSLRDPAARLRDPADRIIAATAREYGYTLITRDRVLLEYAEAGHIRALAC
jgi:PIN domain nuclease of toxin-antitoxin system